MLRGRDEELAELIESAEIVAIVEQVDWRFKPVGWQPWEIPHWEEEPVEIEEEIILGFEAEIDDKTCQDCLYYHGQTFTPEEAEAEFEYLDKASPNIWYPNVHPNCRCRLVVIRIKIIGPVVM